MLFNFSYSVVHCAFLIRFQNFGFQANSELPCSQLMKKDVCSRWLTVQHINSVTMSYAFGFVIRIYLPVSFGWIESFLEKSAIEFIWRSAPFSFVWRSAAPVSVHSLAFLHSTNSRTIHGCSWYTLCSEKNTHFCFLHNSCTRQIFLLMSGLHRC